MNSFYENIFSKTNYQSPNFSRYAMAQQDQPTGPTQPQTQKPSQQQTQVQRPSQTPSAAIVDPYTYPQNVKNALQLILDALNKEAGDAQFYQYLVNQAPTQSDKNIIIDIQKDELRHFDLIGHIYTRITGNPPPAPQLFENIPRLSTYCQGLNTAFLGEIEDGSRYRKILYAMQDRTDVNIMTEIVADEIEHASLYSFLYSKNRCGSLIRGE